MIKAVIFDLNGVFIHSERLSDRFERDFGVPVSEFLPKLGEIMDFVRKPGAEPAFRYWEPALKEWNISMTEEELWKYWFDAEIPSEEMIALARELKEKGIKVITLSNNFKERAEYYGHYPWMQDVMDKTYFSWKTGLVKPDVEAWKLVLSDFALEPSACLYFDDQQKNLDAAESVGIQSCMFKSPEDTRTIIENSIS
ncbi:MAG: HAD-superfamily hydrolase, subfamily variant 3 [Parcubacteria group bacterium]|nr:HAD-superfamily hydrolase, subfamily variant 3 [Parcubacteria group bacterium]